MTYELRDNSGSAFKNERKVESWNADFTGTCMVNSAVMWVNITEKQTKEGATYLHISFRPKDQKPKPAEKPHPVFRDDDGPDF